MRTPSSTATNLSATRREPRLVVGIIFPVGSVYLTNKTGLSNVPGNVVYGALKDISSSSQSIRPDEARATIGTLSFSAVDLSADITDELRSQLALGNGLRGREVRVWSGDTNDFTDFERVETYVIDRVLELEGRTYRFSCSDRTREQRVSIFERKTTRLDTSITKTATTIPVLDASEFETVTHTASFSDAPSSTVGYALIKKTGEVFRYTGKTSVSFTGVTRGVFNTIAQRLDIEAGTEDDKKPEILEFIYLELPAPQLDWAIKTGKIKGTANTLPSHWHMGIAESSLDSDSYDGVGADLYDPSDATAGLVLRFAWLEKIDGKKFAEEQIHYPAGTFVSPGADGVLRLRRMVSLVSGSSPVRSLTSADVINHGPVRHNLDRVINRVRVLWNWNGESFTRERILYNQASIDAHGESPLKEIELYGLHVSRHSTATLRRIFDSISDRYASPPIELSARLSRRHNALEIADTVRLALPRVKDFTSSDYLLRTFEIQSRRINWRTGALDVQLFGSTSKGSISDAGGTGSYLADSWYTSAGTSLSSVLTISSGHVTANGTLSGGSDARTSVWYYAGDLTIDSGVTLTISGNVQLRIRGTLTVNGKIDGAAGGIAAPSNPNVESGSFSGWPDPFANEGYLGTTSGGSGIFHSGGVYARNMLPFLAYGKNQSAPRLALSIAADGSSLAGLPSDIRGTPGMYGGSVVASNNLNYRVGGDGGDSGAGLVIVSRGLAFGVSGEIDLSGEDGSPPSGGSISLGGVSVDVYAGGGAGGSPGALYVILDGDDLAYPDLSTTFTANEGAGVYLGTPGQESYVGGSMTFDSDPGCGQDLPSGAVDLWEAAHIVQYVPATITLGESDDELVAPPENLSATPDGLGVLLEWDPPAGEWDHIEIWESIDNDRSNATDLALVTGSSFYKASPSTITRYYWIRAADLARGVSIWEPVSSTAGVSATFGGDAPISASSIIYYQSAPPSSPEVGWLWVDTDDDNLYRYNGSTWDFVASADALNLTNGPAEADADATVNHADAIIFRQSFQPTSAQEGWLWVDTDDDTVYRYNGATWDFIGSADALNLNNAPAEAGADQTANNADAIIFRQSSSPSSPQAGWLWVDTDDGNVYRHNGTSWVFIGSEDVLALVNAPAEAGADQTANNADAIIFRQSGAPSSPQAGWIWVDSDDGNVYRHNGTSWVFIGSEDALALINAPAEAGADQTASNADAIIFRQASPPSSPLEGWLWVDTDDGAVYRHNGATWDFIGSEDVLALVNAPAEAGADQTANNADAIIFRQSAPPSSPQEGWLWVDTDDGAVYRYNGATWDFIGSEDVLALVNAPAEAGADVTSNNAATIIFRQSTGPGSPVEGWIWVDSDDGSIYRYNGSSWDFIGSEDALSLTNGPAEGGADQTSGHADDIVFRQSTAPSSPNIGWLWVDTDDGNVYRFNGSIWDFIGSADALNLTNAIASDPNNQFPDPNFERGTSWWINFDATWHSIVSDPLALFTNVLRMQGDGASHPSRVLQVDCAEGDTFFVEFWAHKDGAATGSTAALGVVFYWLDESGGTISSTFNSVNFTELTTGWQKFTRPVYTAPAGAVRADIRFSNYTGHASGFIYMAQPRILRFEQGADVTAGHADDIVFYQGAAPVSPNLGWLWVDTDDGNVYRYSGTWDFIGSADALNLTNGPAESGADVTQNNLALIDSIDWTTPVTDPMGDWDMIAGTLGNSSYRADFPGPFGETPNMLQVAGNGTAPGWYSEWAHDFAVDETRPYLVGIWFYLRGSTGNGVYIGIEAGSGVVEDLSGVEDTNYYFGSNLGTNAGLDIQKWYLAIAVVQPNGATDESRICGVWDPETVHRIIPVNDVRWQAGVTSSHMRAGFYSTSTAYTSANGVIFSRPFCYQMNGTEPTLQDLLGRARFGVDQLPGFYSLLPNWNFQYEDTQGKPAGIRSVEGGSDRSAIDYGGIGILLDGSIDTTIAAGFPAIPIDDTAQYLLTIRHRSSAADTDGLYLRWNESAGPLALGKTHVGQSDGEGVVQVRDSSVDLVSNGAMPGTTTVEDSYTYTPTPGTQFATFSMYNWGGFAGDYSVEFVQVTRINNPAAQIFIQSAAPSSPRDGWVWIDTDDANVYRYRSGAGWEQIASNDVTQLGGLLTASQLAATMTFTQELVISASGFLRSGQTAFDTGTGYYLEYNGGNPRFSFGSSSGEKMIWDVSGAELDLTQTETGSFTATTYAWSGGSETKTIYYVRQGRLVTLYVTSALRFVGNGNNFYMTGIPAAIRPTVTQDVLGSTYENNNTSLNIAAGRITSAGRIDFYRYYPGGNELTDVAWTSGQYRGFTSAWRFSYYLDQ